MTGRHDVKHPETLAPTVRRHELDEVRSSNRKGRDLGDRISLGVIRFFKGSRQVGQHASPKVLRREHDHVSYLSKLDPAHNMFHGLRKNNQEYSPEMLKLKNRDIRKIENRASKHNSNLYQKANTDPHGGALKDLGRAFKSSNNIAKIAHNYLKARQQATAQRAQAAKEFRNNTYSVDLTALGNRKK